jgi:ABC-2 type transport system ATP-binding protein
MPAISIRDLHKSYGSIKAVDGISLEVEEREIFGILGPNGAGKTTSLEIIETLREPDAGDIKVLGFDVLKDAQAIKEIIGVQLQTTVFFDYLTVYETIDLFCTFYPRALPIEELLSLAELSDKTHSRVNDLSGGQHKRLSIALALVNDPKIIFLDEPTTGLDPQARRRIWEIVQHLRDQHKTIVITTHYIEEAEYLCDRVAVMDLGRIVAQGTPDQLISENVADSIITFRMHPEIDLDALNDVKGVVSASSEEGQYQVTTRMPQETLMGIVAKADELGCSADEINMKRATLEDVFLKLTGRRIRS